MRHYQITVSTVPHCIGTFGLPHNVKESPSEKNKELLNRYAVIDETVNTQTGQPEFCEIIVRLSL